MKPFIISLFLVSTLSNAQLHFENLTVRDGLSQNSVFSICQDSFGFMWFGTRENGLNRYDGKEYKYYNYGKENDLFSNTILSLLPDENGVIWIGTDNGLNIYNPEDNTILETQYIDKNDIIYSFENKAITTIKKDHEDGVFVVAAHKLYYKDSEKILFQEIDLPLKGFISEIEPLGNHEYLVTSGTKVYIYNKKINAIKESDIVDGQRLFYINTIFKAANENVFFGTDRNGFAFYSKKDNTTHYFTIETTEILKSGFIRSFGEDENGNIYIGTFNGLYVLNVESLKLRAYFSDEANTVGLSHHSIFDIYKDYTGNIWIGTYSGGVNVKYKTNNNFITYNNNPNAGNSIASNVINIFYEDESGMWIGTDGGGLSLFSDNTFENFRNDSLKNDFTATHIKGILNYDKDHLWIVGHQSGLDLFNKKKKIVIKKMFPKSSIYDIQRDGRGNLWLGSSGEGLLFLNEKSKSIITKKEIPNDLKRVVKNILYSSKKDMMWVASKNKIYLYDFDKDQFIQVGQNNADIQNINTIHQIFEDSKQKIWIGTSSGLFKILDVDKNTGACTTQLLNADNLLDNDNVMSIAEDNEHQIWIGTISGLSKIKPDLSHIKTYNHQYNIQGNEFSLKAAYRSKDGKMWFGGNEGFSVFRPSDLEENKYVPKLCFTDISVNNESLLVNQLNKILTKSIAFTKEIRLKHYQNNILISVASLNYILPKRNKYKWIFTDNNTIEIRGSNSEININNISPGKYKLSVWGSNNDELWNETPLELTVFVSLPWWRSPLAYLGYFLFFSAIAGGIIKVYSGRRKALRQLELEKFKKKQEKELNEQKMSFFTNISHEIRTPLSLISGPIQEAFDMAEDADIRQNLAIAKRNTNYLKQLVDQLIDFRKTEKGSRKLTVTKLNIQDFVFNICDLFEKSLKQDSVKINFESAIDKEVYFDPHKLEKILFNLITNALKYNRNGALIYVHLGTTYLPATRELKHTKIFGNNNFPDQSNIVISVEDGGIGISKESLPKIFERYYQIEDSGQKHLGAGIGLALVKKLALLHKGEIKVDSSRDVGSKFSVRIPIEKEAYTNKELSNDDTLFENRLFITKEEVFEPKISKSKKTATILIVEDNIELQSWMKMFLEKRYNCIVASNGKEGVDKAIQKSPDLIISDVMMPEMNGYELCAEIKDNIATSHIPVLLLTAKISAEEERKGRFSGADSYITKPFDAELLIHRIENFISLRQRIVEKYNLGSDESSSFVENLSVQDRRLVKALNNYINLHLSDTDLSMSTMASELALSRSSLFRKIKVLTNSSPNDFVKNYRLEKSVPLIKEKRLTINEVSEAVGFNDVYYFKKCFVKKYGVKPEQL